MKSSHYPQLWLCVCAGWLSACGPSDNQQANNKELVPITILHPTSIEFPDRMWPMCRPSKKPIATTCCIGSASF